VCTEPLIECTLFDGILVTVVAALIIHILWVNLTKPLISELEATAAADWIVNRPAQPPPQLPMSNRRAHGMACMASMASDTTMAAHPFISRAYPQTHKLVTEVRGSFITYVVNFFMQHECDQILSGLNRLRDTSGHCTVTYHPCTSILSD